MALWFAALLGVVQGLTEFIPISSSAHLRILPAVLGIEDPGAAYTAVIQLGTLVAVLVYFAKDLIALPGAMLQRDLSTPAGRLPWLLAAATVPIVVVGLLLKKQIEGDLRSLYVIVIAMISVGIAMAVIDRIASGRGSRPLDAITLSDAVLVGLAQTLAVVPGVSRSGATICMALLLGFSRSDSARFSFLLSIPAIAGAGIFELRTAIVGSSAVPALGRLAVPALGREAIPALLVGTGTAFVVGYFSIAWFIKWLGSHDLLGFAIYRVVAGLALLAALLRGAI